MKIPKLIWDDGTPSCLPEWAREEIVRLRLRNYDLEVHCARLMFSKNKDVTVTDD